MSGPLPNPNRRRRNAPTIPTTDLPAGGFKGPTPKVPDGYDLQEQGAAWWAWAWKLPQAAGWSPGDLYVIARRASIEDALGGLRGADLGMDVEDMLDDETGEALRYLVGRLKSLVGGELQLDREARELDDRLGLTPKGLAALRWKIVDDVVDSRPAASAPKRGRKDEAMRLIRGEAV